MTQGPKLLSVFATSQVSWFWAILSRRFLVWKEVRYRRFCLKHTIYFTMGNCKFLCPPLVRFHREGVAISILHMYSFGGSLSIGLSAKNTFRWAYFLKLYYAFSISVVVEVCGLVGMSLLERPSVSFATKGTDMFLVRSWNARLSGRGK